MPDLPTGTVTFLFTDIEGSTRLLQHLGDRYPAVLEEHHHLLRAAFRQSGGHEMSMEGDSFSIVFPRASDAVAAAVAAQRALAAHPWPAGAPVRVRMGLHTGEPTLTASGYVGLDVHRAARISAAGHGGQVLLSKATRELVGQELPEGVSLWELGSYRLKDLPQPEMLYQLIIAGLPADFPPLKALDSRPHNLLVPPTPPIGREREVSGLRELLQEGGRLVTLTGPGGTGKTRLGLQVAQEVLESLPDGVFFVDLAPIRDASLVASTIGHTLGLREEGGRSLLESLKEYLREKQMLLLLDNFEQVLPAAPVIAELLAHCPRLKVLVTSRAPLNLRGEQEFPVAPLALPDLQRLPATESLSGFPAVALFIERALAVRPDFNLSHQTAPAVAEICHRLDGLPLAIELAAARVRLFSPSALLTRMERRLPLLVGGARDLPARQQTLRDTIAWSYELLTEKERILFRRLSVFVGGCTLEAAEAICSVDGDLELDVLAGLGSLVEKSLLRQQEGPEGEPRFGMLETLREYGQESLDTSGETAFIRRQHARCFLSLAETMESQFADIEPAVWLAQLEKEHDNFRAALDWCLSGEPDAEMGLRLAGALWRFWFVGGYLREGQERLVAMLARPGAEEPTRERARALAGAAVVAVLRGDLGPATALAEPGLLLSRELAERPSIALSLNVLGTMARYHGEYETAAARYEEALPLAREVEDRWLVSLCLYNLGTLMLLREDHERAAALYEEALALSRKANDEWFTALCLSALARLALYRGDSDRAVALLEESLSRHHAVGSRWMIAVCLDGLAGVSLARGEPERAARLLGAEDTLWEAAGSSVWLTIRGDHDRCMAAARAELGESAFSTAWAEGRAMNVEQAIGYALDRSMRA
jgi:predicted ATPase/class 3 adenylate cyclase